MYYFLESLEDLREHMSWLFNVIDFIPVVGTVSRLTQASVLAITGQGDEALDALKSAGLNLAGDAVGLLTAGVGKAAFAGTRAAVKITQAAATQAGKTALRAAEKAAMQAAEKAAVSEAGKQADSGARM